MSDQPTFAEIRRGHDLALYGWRHVWLIEAENTGPRWKRLDELADRFTRAETLEPTDIDQPSLFA